MADLTAEQKAQADTLITELEKEGTYESWKYMSARVPQEFQEYFLSGHPDPSVPAQTAAA